MLGNKNIEEGNYLFGDNKQVAFTMPTDYFNALEQRIINKIEAAEEASEFSILAGINKQNEFIIPDNYFAKAENILEHKVELEGLSELSKITKPVLKLFTSEYLNSLTETITNKITLQDELKEYATLYSLEKENAFAISADYFDTIADSVKEKVHSKSKVRISIIDNILAFIFKPKYSVAFGILVIIGVSSVIYFNKNKTVITDGDCKTLACLEKREMLNERTVREMDDENLYDMVDVDKLDEQLTKVMPVDSASVKK